MIKYGSESVEYMNIIILQFVKITEISRYSLHEPSMSLGIKHHHPTNVYPDTKH